MDNLLLFVILSIVIEVIGTIGGFGSSMLFIPIASYFFDFHTVLGLTALYHVFSNSSKIYFFRKGIDRKLLLNIGVPSVVFVSIGAILSNYVESDFLMFILGIFLVLFSSFLLYFKNFQLKSTKINAILGGTISGFLAGVLGTGGAIRGLTLSAFMLSKDVFIATSALIDLALDITRSGIYIFNGYVDEKMLFLIPVLILISFFGTFFGKIILRKMSDTNFKFVVLLLILLTGGLNIFMYLKLI